MLFRKNRELDILPPPPPFPGIGQKAMEKSSFPEGFEFASQGGEKGFLLEKGILNAAKKYEINTKKSMLHKEQPLSRKAGADKQGLRQPPSQVMGSYDIEKELRKLIPPGDYIEIDKLKELKSEPFSIRSLLKQGEYIEINNKPGSGASPPLAGILSKGDYIEVDTVALSNAHNKKDIPNAALARKGSKPHLWQPGSVFSGKHAPKIKKAAGSFNVESARQEINYAIDVQRMQPGQAALGGVSQKQVNGLPGLFRFNRKPKALPMPPKAEKTDGAGIIQDRIYLARQSLMGMDTDAARSAYIEIMQIYLKLKPEEQALVYNDIRELYNERKSAENIKTRRC